MARKDLGPVSDLIATLDLPDETKQFIAEQYQAGKITIQGIRDLAREVATRVVEAGREGLTPGITKATASRDFYIALGDFDAGLTGIETVVQAAENAKKVGLKLEVPRPKWLKDLGLPQNIQDVLYEQYKSGNITEPAVEQLKNYPKATGSFTWEGTTVGSIGDLLSAMRNAFKVSPLPVGPEADLVRTTVTNYNDKELAAESSRLNKAISSGAKSYTFEGRTYTLSQARDLIRPLIASEVFDRNKVKMGRDPELLKQQIAAEKALSQSAADKALASRQYRTALFDFNRGSISEEQLRAAEEKVASTGLDVERARVVAREATEPIQRRVPEGAADRAEQARFAEMQRATGAPARAISAQAQRMAGLAATAGGGAAAAPTATTPAPTSPAGGGGAGGGGGGGGGGGTRPVTRQQVDAEIASTGVADTAENRKAIRARLAAGEKIPSNWEARFRQEFPQYQYLLDETVFGADMTALLQRAVLEKWFDSDEAKTLMEQGFAATEYAQNTTTNQQNFDKLTPGNKQAQIDKYKLEIKQAYGNLQIDDASLTTIATKAARDAKTGKGLELFIYQEALAKPVGTNVYAMQTAATRALTSGEADRIRQIGRDYGFQLSNQEVEDVLTGRKTEEELRQSYKIAARRWYKGVAEDLDAGLTIDQIFKPYRQYAAQILEKPIDQIDLVDTGGAPSIYSEALQGQDGPLSLTEWAQKLKSDPKYGYQYTSRANQEVSSVVRSLEKAFGFTR